AAGDRRHTEGTGLRSPAGPARAARRRLQVPEVRRVDPARPQPRGRARRDGGTRRTHGQRPDFARLPCAASLRRQRGKRGPRRPALLGRRPHRGGDRGGAGARARRCHGPPGRAPTVDSRARGPGGPDRGRDGRRHRHPRRADEVERAVSGAALPGVAAGVRGGAGVSTVQADRWRGVAAEEVDEFSPSVAGLLRRRSRRLLGTLARPYRWELALAALLIAVRSAAYLSVAYLVGLGIDRGIRPGGTGNLTTLVQIVGLLLVALVINAAANYAFLRLTGRIGANVLFDLRQMLFAHVQELSISFYERYTSGRIISRLTSDIDALNDLLATGLTSVITSLISVVAISAILLHLDLRLGMLVLVAMPIVVALTYWFRVNSARSYRAVRRAIVLVIVHYVESLGGIRAVQAFRREPRNQEIF